MHRLLAFHDGRRLDRQFLLTDDQDHHLGRASDNDVATDWDDQISRQHIILTPSASGVRIQLLDNASNPVFVDGDKVTDTVLGSGQSFVIGRRRTPTRPLGNADHQAEPVLGLRLQRGRHPNRSRRPLPVDGVVAIAGDRLSRHGALKRFRRHE